MCRPSKEQNQGERVLRFPQRCLQLCRMGESTETTQNQLRFLSTPPRSRLGSEERSPPLHPHAAVSEHKFITIFLTPFSCKQ